MVENLYHLAEDVPRMFAVHVAELDAIRTTSHECIVLGWIIWRHWPGEGSRSMAWCVRRSDASDVVRVATAGRAHLLEVRPPAAAQGLTRLVGHHAPHGDDELLANLDDLEQLIRGRPRCGDWLVLGDCNANLMPGRRAAPAAGGAPHSASSADGAPLEESQARGAGAGWRTGAYRALAAKVWLPHVVDPPAALSGFSHQERVARLPPPSQLVDPTCLDVVLAPTTARPTVVGR